MRMSLNKIQIFVYRLNKNAFNNRLYTQLKATLLLSFFMLSGVSATAAPDKYYLAIEHNISSGNDDLDVTSVGMLSLKDNMAGFAKLSYLESDIDEKGSTLDLGGGYSFNGDVSLPIFLKSALWWTLQKHLELRSAANDILYLYEKDEDIVMLGLVFRK